MQWPKPNGGAAAGGEKEGGLGEPWRDDRGTQGGYTAVLYASRVPANPGRGTPSSPPHRCLLPASQHFSVPILANPPRLLYYCTYLMLVNVPPFALLHWVRFSLSWYLTNPPPARSPSYTVIDLNAPFAVAFDHVGLGWAQRIVAAGALTGIVTRCVCGVCVGQRNGKETCVLAGAIVYAVAMCGNRRGAAGRTGLGAGYRSWEAWTCSVTSIP